MEITFYTVDQIAKLLKIHPKTIQRYIREGKLKAVKVGKSWRVDGHDLSVFVEGPGIPEKATRPLSERHQDRIKVSAVVDMEVNSMNEAMRIVDMLQANLNAKPPEYGHASMTANYLESELKLRLMLWGNEKVMKYMMEDISAISDIEF